MITEDIIIKFKSASKKQKQEMAEILIANYAIMIHDIVKEADYACSTAYWKDFIPASNKSMEPKEFIEKYGKLRNNKKVKKLFLETLKNFIK